MEKSSIPSGKIWDAVIVGAGFSGLSAGYGLRDKNVCLLERQEEAGGRVKTLSFDGISFDMGAVLACHTDGIPFPIPSEDVLVEESPIGYYDGERLLSGDNLINCVSKSDRVPSEVIGQIKAFQQGEVALSQCSRKARDILNAFFRVIHPGEIEDYNDERQRDAFQS